MSEFLPLLEDLAHRNITVPLLHRAGIGLFLNHEARMIDEMLKALWSWYFQLSLVEGTPSIGHFINRDFDKLNFILY